MASQLLETPAALEPNSLPPEFPCRDQELQRLQETVTGIQGAPGHNLHIRGNTGQGKTHLTQRTLDQAPDQVNTCYVPCKRCDTQYKALKQVYTAVTREQVSDGYHTSDLIRSIEEHIQAIPLVVVLDDIDFALLKDGDSLLYALSRIDHRENISIITTSNQHVELPIEERTKSSLQPLAIELPQYTGKQVYEVLGTRAQDAFTPQSLHRDALTYLASTTSNIGLGLTWLKTAAQTGDNAVTEETVRTVQEDALQNHAHHLLQDFTQHHRLLYQALQELTEEQETDVIHTGAIYTRYQELCQTYSEEPLSNRRISDFLKHLELLDLIEAKYHYGGRKGKTREIALNHQ